MAWRQPGDKPLSEPMMVRLPTHICVTRPQWVKYQSRTHTRQDHDHDSIGMQIYTLVPKGAHYSAIDRGVLDFCLTVSFNLVERITLFKRPTRTHESRNSVIFFNPSLTTIFTFTIQGICLGMRPCSPWDTSLHCNDVSHWLGAYLDWSLLSSIGHFDQHCVLTYKEECSTYFLVITHQTQESDDIDGLMQERHC